MLQSMKPKVSKLLRLGMGMDSNNAAFIAKFVRSQHLAVSLLALSQIKSALRS
jgi:hypothetical protein